MFTQINLRFTSTASLAQGVKTVPLYVPVASSRGRSIVSIEGCKTPHKIILPTLVDILIVVLTAVAHLRQCVCCVDFICDEELLVRGTIDSWRIIKKMCGRSFRIIPIDIDKKV